VDRGVVPAAQCRRRNESLTRTILAPAPSPDAAADVTPGAQRDLSDLDDTLDILRAAVAASPRNPALRRQLAALLTRSGRHDEAVEHLREALKDAPEDAAIPFALAEAYLALERRGHALVVLESLVAK